MKDDPFKFSLKQMALLSTFLSGAFSFQSSPREHYFLEITPLKNSVIPLRQAQISTAGRVFKFKSHQPANALQMKSSDTQQMEYQSSTAETFFSWLLMLLPLVSAAFPALMYLARSQPSGSVEQVAMLATLYASNRLYLYAMSTTIVALVALRSGSQDRASLGGRVVDLTEELLYRPPLKGSGKVIQQSEPETRTAKKTTPIFEEYEESALSKNLSREVGDSLDKVSSGTQAVLLPVLVSALFVSSFVFVKLLNREDSVLAPEEIEDLELGKLLQTYGPLLISLWNGLLLTLFTRCELRRFLFLSKVLPLYDKESTSTADTWLPWLGGVVVTALAFGGVWQAQNFVNIALAVLVARAIQINNTTAILGALSLLTFYDVTSVLFLPANAAAMDSSILTSNILAASSDALETAKSSAMGSVAVDKLTSGNFQPGLLVTKLEGRITGALGLGDAVFPSLLATIARRFDLERKQDDGSDTVSLFAASMVGYVSGCLACEVVPFLSTIGVPALLLIVPFMVGSTLAAAAVQGNLDSFFEFAPEKNNS